jgi:hypothetical protein
MPARCRTLTLGAMLSLAWGCAASKPHPGRAVSTHPADSAAGAVPVISTAAVIAFWLAESDTLPEAVRRDALANFRRSNARIAKYLSDTDIGVVATVRDSLVVQLAGGKRRYLMLSGLDYPFGYVLIEPGYAEEYHTGLTADQDLIDAIDDYFGLERDGSGPKHRIAQGAPLHPGPRTSLPGLAPLWAPSFTTSVPFTSTCVIPTESWWGCSKVARSAMVVGSNTTRSA